MGHTFIFDLDNTLIRNQAYYDEAKHGFAETVLDTLEPAGYDTPQDVVDLVDAHDSDLYNRLSTVRDGGVTRTRFAYGCRMALEQIAAEENLDPASETVSDLLTAATEYGMTPFVEYGYEDLLPGAEDALDYLEQEGSEIIIMTKGIPAEQQKKLAATGLDRYEHHIVGTKDDDAFDAVVGDRDMAAVWKVGDSQRSDIEPALAYGINAIHIPQDTWKAEESTRTLDPSHPWMRITSLEEMQDAYDAVTAFDEVQDVAVLPR